MSRSVRFVVAVLALFALLFAAPIARTQPAAPPAVDAVARAKELFRRGVALFDADVELALDLFQRSRAEYPSANNTLDAALCLERLGRPDEALDLYDELLASFEKDLTAADRDAVTRSVARLAPGAGSIEVVSDVDGASVLVDGRPRGKLPRRAPFHARAGSHVVRVLKGGRRTFEASADVTAGSTARVVAHLAPLDHAGTLRVEDPGNDGATLFVDRASVGTTPWEGTLGPGAHAVWSQRGEVGSAPTLVTVVEAQTMIVRLRSARLGPTTTLVATPASAAIALGDAPLGAGSWEGRLPPGSYTLSASEPGYHARSIAFIAPPADGRALRVDVKLDIDSADPRWGPRAKPDGTVFFFGPLGGYGGFSSDVTSHTAYLAGARGGARYHGFAVEAMLGYTHDANEQHDLPVLGIAVVGNTPASAPYDGTHAKWGPLAAIGISYRWNVFWRVGVLPRVAVGAIAATTAFDGMTAINGTSTKLVNDRSTKGQVFGLAELGFDLRLDPVWIGASISNAPLGGTPLVLTWIEYAP